MCMNIIISFLLGNYLGGEFCVAYDVIAKFFEGVTNEKIMKTAEEKHAESELILFQNRCLEKQNKFDVALIHLRNQKNKLVDELSFRVKEAELLVLSGRFNEAKIMWNLLVQDQGENYRYHTGLQVAVLRLDVEQSKKMFLLKKLELPSTTLSLTNEQKDILLLLYKSNSKKFKSKAFDKILLTIARDSELKILLEEFIRKSLKSEIPALCQDLFSLIRDSGSKILKDSVEFKIHPISIMVVEIVNRFVENLRESDTFDGLNKEHSEEHSLEDLIKEAPGVYLWCMYLQCQFLIRSGELIKALAVIDQCLAHTPTALDMFSTRARILKKCGDLKEATAVMNYCRSLGPILIIFNYFSFFCYFIIFIAFYYTPCFPSFYLFFTFYLFFFSNTSFIQV